MPYFRILCDEEATEATLNLPRVLVGREKSLCDVVVYDQSVSRIHFLLVKLGEEYSIFDLHSSSGTILNGTPVSRADLKHGDNIEIGGVVMEYRTDNLRTQASMLELKNADEEMLLENFRLLPSGVKVKYRVVQVAPEKMFSIGDTLMVGQGGVLLPTGFGNDIPRDCLVELELTMPNGQKRFMLGELISRMDSLNAICLKMHSIDRKKYDALVGLAKRGNWMDTAAARESVEERLARRAK